MQITPSAAKPPLEGGLQGALPLRQKRERPRHEGEGGVSAPWSGSGLVQADSGRRGDPERKDQRRDEADADGGHFFRSSGGPVPPVERFASARKARVKQGAAKYYGASVTYRGLREDAALLAWHPQRAQESCFAIMIVGASGT